MRLNFVVIFFLVTFDVTLKVKVLYLAQFYVINIYVQFCDKVKNYKSVEIVKLLRVYLADFDSA
jgi:hypothetical protein